MAKRVKVGDVFSIKTPNGYGYIQYIYNDDEYWYLIRKISGKFNTILKEEKIDEIIQNSTDFYIFYPLQTAINESEKKAFTKEWNIIEVILSGNFNITEKDTNPMMLEWQKGHWSLRIKGEEKYLGKILPEKYKWLSIASIANHESLIFKIDSNYKSEDNIHFTNC
jgi:hypothetical protein